MTPHLFPFLYSQWGLAKPACFDGCHAERPRGSKLISPRLLYISLGLKHPFFHQLEPAASSRLVLVIVYSWFNFNVCICLRFPRNTSAIFITTTIYVCNCCSRLCRASLTNVTYNPLIWTVWSVFHPVK